MIYVTDSYNAPSKIFETQSSMDGATWLLTYTQEASDSNLCRDVGYPDRSCVVSLGPTMEILV